MKFGKYGWSYIVLRCGLGFVFVWIGVDILRHPDAWIGFLPVNIPFGLDRSLALQINGIIDVGIGLLFFLNILPKLTALAAAAHLAGIVIIQGIDAILIRDVGLCGAALALLLWPQHGRRRIRWQFWRRSRRHTGGEEAM